MKHFLTITLTLCLSAILFSSCSSDSKPDAPSISLGDNNTGTFSAKAGFPLTISPVVANSDGAQYTWTLDGKSVGSAPSYTFTATTPGNYTLTLTVKTAGGEDSKQLTIIVDPVDAHYRPATAASKAACTQVFAYTPAPGQFINEKLSGFAGENTPEAACNYALQRLNKTYYVSLGGFGGYLVAGFDHSIYNESGADFSVTGNSFEGGSEPGIVYVMQDKNGNGLPDDTWYELKGSEYGKTETIRNYEVTYFKPQNAAENVRWEDNQGGSGEIEYLSDFHTQDSYYPAWITDASYKLSGTRLKARTALSEDNTTWINASFDWGYADNFSTKDGTGGANAGGGPRANTFDIDNAVTSEGQPAALRHIDLVKIQTGVNAQAGWIGEVSTEVLGIKDLKAGK